MATEYVLAMNDLHCGAKMGLLNPATVLEYDGPDGKPDIHAPEKYAWPTYIWAAIIVPGLHAFADITHGDPVTLFPNGDLVHGIQFLQSLQTSLRVQQRTIAEDVLKYFYSQLNIQHTYICFGTEWHTGEDGEEEQSIAKTLSAEGYAVTAIPFARVTVNGAEFSIAHHGPYVGEAQLRSNSPILHLRRRMYEEITILQRQPPACYLYGHRHRYAHVWHAEPVKGKDYTSHLIVVPALCPMSGYARAVSNSAPILFTGMVLIKIVDGEIANVNRDYVHEVDMRQVFNGAEKMEPQGGVVSHKYEGEKQKEKREGLLKKLIGRG